MDPTATAKAYRERADAREASRLERFEALRRQAREIAEGLREAFGVRLHVYLFGSLLDLLRFRGDSDIDLAVAGLTAAEYWQALAIVDSIAGTTSVDLVRMESAAASLREAVLLEGEPLT